LRRAKKSPSKKRGPATTKKAGDRPRAGGSQKFSIPKGSRLVPGTHAVLEAISVRPSAVSQIFVKPGFESAPEVANLKLRADRAGISWSELSLKDMDKIYHGHQGLMAVVGEDPEVDWDDLKSKDHSQVLVLDGLEDPHNLGAILRTAWLMKVDAIFVPENRAVQYSPAAMKVASGGAEHVPVEAENNLASVMESLKDLGFWFYGLSHKGEQEIWDVDFPEKIAWVIGSEAKGIRKSVARACDELVRIPQASPGASYNASVSAGIAIAEIARQRVAKGLDF
jgi:23S rRNA (guanosine2251-2'-O)-methyltransferase